ncbi:MAG: LPS export ABC transporter periplasmic protein LptC [Elusimicrobiaceae bacterium]|nr:LPS export ABC transporter periplasmic protein LptC [Elusimicrobiaceae bacterium]
MKKLPLLLVWFVSFSLPVWAEQNVLPQPDEEKGFVYFTADEASADPAAKKINLKGNVTLVQQTQTGEIRTAKGEDITFDQVNTTISSLGPMTVEGMGATVSGNNVSVNYKTKDFYAEDIQTEYPPLRVISAKEISMKDGTERLKGAVLTCCDNPDPHYTITLGNLKVSPEKRVFGTNAVFKLDGFPIMWLPVFWRSLDSQKPWTTHVDFTQSGDTGFGILTSNVFQEVAGFRPKVNLDYYTKSGVGLGLELMAVESETLRGTGEVYYINDRSSSDEEYTLDGHPFQLQDTKRWGMRGGYWWEMYDSSDHFNNNKGALYQFQTQFRMVSDPYFNDSFFRGNPYIFTPDQETNFSLSRQSRRSTLRLSYTQIDIFDWQRGDFIAKERNMPQLDYTLLPFKDRLLGLTHRMEVNFNNTSHMEEEWKKQGSARWTTEKSIRLTKGLTFLPSVFYDQHVSLDDDDYNDKTAWVGRVGTDLNLQTDTPIGTLDFGYQYTKRLSTGTLKTDTSSLDHGEERNRLYLENYYRPSFNTYVRLATGFSLANHDVQNNSWQHLKHRVEPILLEAGYNSPDGKINLFAQNLYDLIEKNQAFIAQTNFMIKGQHLGIGLTNYDTTESSDYALYKNISDAYTFTTNFGLRLPNATWSLDLGTDFQIQSGSFDSFNKLIRLTKRFHDAIGELTVRDRNDNLSFAFRISVLCGKDGRKETQQNAQDAYWYPWRSENDLRDM